MNKTGKTKETMSNSKTSDSGAKLIFGNATLCAQLLRDYADIDILKDVRAGYSGCYRALHTDVYRGEECGRCKGGTSA